MQKPNNFENTRATGDFTPVEIGGHHMIIKQVTETKSKAGKDMLVVLFDFAPNDKQAGYFMDQFKSDVRPDKKWPRQGTQYIVAEDQNGNCSRSFKTFINVFEKSNNTVAQWGDVFCRQFKDKKIGGVFGKVENEYNGKVTLRPELRWFCEDSKADEARIPEDKLLPGKPAPAIDADGFMDVSGTDEEIPFL